MESTAAHEVRATDPAYEARVEAPVSDTAAPPSVAGYYLTAGAAGFCMMGLEILAGPMLEPAFGEGKDVWAGIISVFILSLSVGYSAGGWLADKYDTRRALGAVLLGGGLLYVAMPLYAFGFIEALHTHVHQMRTGALIASMGLFFLPSVLLGMVTPMLVKLVFHGEAELGTTTGTLYSVAAVGNVVGVLCTNFLLVETFGLSGTLLGMGLVLVVSGAGQLLARRPK